MARAGNPYSAVSPQRRPKLGPGAGTLAAGTLAACATLVLPIVLWKRFGDDHLPRTAAVMLAALLLCWVVVRVVTRRYADRRIPGRPLTPPTVATAPSCHSRDIHRSASGRDRRDPSARPCGPSRCRPLRTSRGPRDVHCDATRQLDRRTARRRTRP